MVADKDFTILDAPLGDNTDSVREQDVISPKSPSGWVTAIMVTPQEVACASSRYLESALQQISGIRKPIMNPGTHIQYDGYID
jgi:hypothetical protein